MNSLSQCEQLLNLTKQAITEPFTTVLGMFRNSLRNGLEILGGKVRAHHALLREIPALLCDAAQEREQNLVLVNLLHERRVHIFMRVGCSPVRLFMSKLTHST